MGRMRLAGINVHPVKSTAIRPVEESVHAVTQKARSKKTYRTKQRALARAKALWKILCCAISAWPSQSPCSWAWVSMYSSELAKRSA